LTRRNARAFGRNDIWRNVRRFILLNEILPRGTSRGVGHSAVTHLAVWAVVRIESLRIHEWGASVAHGRAVADGAAVVGRALLDLRVGHRLRGDGEDEDRGGEDCHEPSSPRAVGEMRLGDG